MSNSIQALGVSKILEVTSVDPCGFAYLTGPMSKYRQH